MMLWHKILLVSLSLYMLSFSISSVFFLSQTHLSEIEQETSRAFSDQALINERVTSGIAAIGPNALRQPEPLVRRYADYYTLRQIELAIFSLSEQRLYGELSQAITDPALLTPSGQDQVARIIRSEADDGSQVHTIFVSSRLNNHPEYLLVYARDISNLYDKRSLMIRTFSVIAAGIALLMSLAAYLMAKKVTRPLKKLADAATEVADGQYKLLKAETRDETASLVSSFNRMTEAVQQRELILEESATQRQHFIDNLTHEMNTPLTAIQGYAELLYQAHISETQKEKAAETIVRESKRLRMLQDKLTQLILLRQKMPDVKTFELNGFFQQVETAMKPQLDEKNLRLVIENKMNQIKADPDLLMLMLSNLIRNSIQASEDGNTITLRSDLSPDDLPRLCVIDHGCGIPKALQSKVFEPFYRVDLSRSRKTGGTGLGLALCQQIADLHQGKLELESEPGTGTTIYFTTLIQPRDDMKTGG